MKNKIKMISVLLAVLVMVGIVSATPIVKVPLINPLTPIYDEGKFAPLVFLKMPGGRLLIDNDKTAPPGIWGNGNITARGQDYAFTGEMIEWRVLVWDKNGMPEKIQDVWAGWADQTNGPVDPETQMNCQLVATLPSEQTLLSSMGYSNVRRPGDQESQIYFNPATMREYVCRLTIENSCYGQEWMGVKAVDLDQLTGTMLEAESWFCNPEVDLEVSGAINFGTLGPGEQGAATFSVKNMADEGSGAMVVIAISGEDFYDPSSSGAMCPSSNVLSMQGVDAPGVFDTGFWYTVNSPAATGNKRIPYGDSIYLADPVFSTGTGMTKNWANAASKALSPGSGVSMTLHLGLPQPCNGQFTDGQIYLWAYTV